MKKIFQKIKEKNETVFKSRFSLIFLILGFSWFLIIFKAFRIHFFPDQRIDQFYQSQFHKKIILKPRRGTIYDRNNRELAVSTPSFSLYVDPTRISNTRKTALILSRYLKTPSSKIRKKIKNKNRRFVLIYKHLNKKLKNKIQSLKIKGIYFRENLLRVYPNGNFLSQLIGFVGSEGNGLEGLELEYNEILRGKEKVFLVQRDAFNRPLISREKSFPKNPQGSNIYLTIDSEFQFILEKELHSAMDHFEADSAVGLILNAKTAEILALANLPSFNLNFPLKSKDVHRRNRVMTDAFEPGSIMKAFTIASALEKNVIQRETKFDCEEGRWKVGGHTIREAHSNTSFKFLSTSEILAFSSNIGASKIALKMSDALLRKSLKDFGFGKPTGIKFPGEGRGILQKLPWKPHLLSNISFGHGISATPLQIARAFTAFTNEGTIMNPYIVKAIENSDTKEKIHFNPTSFKKVLSPLKALLMKKMLQSATDKNATGFRAKPLFFQVAGKTSTAQKFNPQKGGYFKNAHISSFIGMIPVLNPKFIIYISLDNPKTKYYASVVAAPVFSKVAGFVARKANLNPAPDFRTNERFKKTFSLKEKKSKSQKSLTTSTSYAILENSSSMRKVPKLKGLTLREVFKKHGYKNIKFIIKGKGRVFKTWPAQGQAILKNKKVKIWLK